VKWFRYQWPAFARLLEHPHNEGNGLNRRQQAIANAEGVTKGVADLVLHVPSYYTSGDMGADFYHSLAIEMKSATGTQSTEQKTWQRMFEAAGGKYVIARSYDCFVGEVTKWMMSVPSIIVERVRRTHEEIEREAAERVRQQLRSMLKK